MKRILRHRSFQIVLREWAAYLETRSKPEDFSWWLENLMAEPRALKGYPRLRELLGLFAREIVIKDRRWSAIRAGLPRRWARPGSPLLASDAQVFYLGLRKRLSARIKDYLASRGGRPGQKTTQNPPKKGVLLHNIQAWVAPYLGSVFLVPVRKKAVRTRVSGPPGAAVPKIGTSRI